MVDHPRFPRWQLAAVIVRAWLPNTDGDGDMEEGLICNM